QLVNFPFGLQPALGEIGSAAIGERPHQALIFRPILRHDYLEREPAASWIEMGWLTLIAVAQIKIIVRPERYIDLFFRISVQITEVEGKRAVRIALPAIEGRTDVQSTTVFSPWIGELSVQACTASREKEKKRTQSQSKEILRQTAFRHQLLNSPRSSPHRRVAIDRS